MDGSNGPVAFERKVLRCPVDESLEGGHFDRTHVLTPDKPAFSTPRVIRP